MFTNVLKRGCMVNTATETKIELHAGSSIIYDHEAGTIALFNEKGKRIGLDENGDHKRFVGYEVSTVESMIRFIARLFGLRMKRTYRRELTYYEFI